MRRALDAYRIAAERGASPSEIVAAVIAAHEADRVELETAVSRASVADVFVARRLLESSLLTVEEAGAVRRLVELAEYHLRTDMRDPLAEIERSAVNQEREIP